jgi:hypothetical protein
MKFGAKRVVTVAMLGFGLLAGRGAAAQEAATEGPKVIVTRIFTGADGLSHAEDIELKRGPGGLGDMLKATGARLTSQAPTPGADPSFKGVTPASAKEWHNGPARQFVITLTGHSEVEVGGGVHVDAGPGHINLIEDTTGKGHITRVFGPEGRIELWIPLADGVLVQGKVTPRTK